jgi:hypothetical protein
MDTERQTLNPVDNANSSRFNDPMVLGLGAFFVGFIVGSGRWNWFGKEAGRLANSLGTLALGYVTQSFQEHNPQLFSKSDRVTH